MTKNSPVPCSKITSEGCRTSSWWLNEAVDVLFLDIQMPGLTGVEFLRTLKTRPVVIFTTAYPDYALEGYTLDVIDYLLKPFSFERFVQAVNKAGEMLRLKAGNGNTAPAAPEEEPARDFILVKSEHKIHRIKYDDILYIESMREYVAYYTPNGRILSLNSLKSLEEELPSDRFIRIHKSYIVSLEKIDTLEGNQLHVGKEKLPIGASYREEVLGRIFK
jgi:DNA-binding LytR/AlgR family response regulator